MSVDIEIYQCLCYGPDRHSNNGNYVSPYERECIGKVVASRTRQRATKSTITKKVDHNYPWDNIGLCPRLSDSFFDNKDYYSHAGTVFTHGIILGLLPR